MKRLLVGLILLSVPAMAADNIYSTGFGNFQAPANCGENGQVLTTAGNCVTSWASAPPPTSLLSSINSWTGQQTFTSPQTYAADIVIGSENSLYVVGSGGTARLWMEAGFGGLDLLGVSWFTVASDSGHLSMGAGIDSGIRRLGAGYIGVTNGMNGVGHLSASKIDLSAVIDPSTDTPSAVNELAFDASHNLYVGTALSAGAWTKIGSQ